MTKRQRIKIQGRVQGVGCRPFIHRLAEDLGLTGLVFNETAGVTIEIQGSPQKIDKFTKHLHSENEKPPLLEIVSSQIIDIPTVSGESDFSIQTSDTDGTPVSQVTPDSATCPDCLSEMLDARDLGEIRFEESRRSDQALAAVDVAPLIQYLKRANLLADPKHIRVETDV